MHALDRDFPGGNAAALLGDYLVVATDTELATMDISDPTNPEPAGSVPLPTGGLDVALSGTIAYVAGYTGGIHIVDLSDPGFPELEGSLAAYDEATGVDVEGDRLALANGLDGVTMFDISDPRAPAALGTYDTVGISTGVDLHWPLVHVADWLSYTILDFTDPGHPDDRGVTGPVSSVTDVAVQGNRAAVAGFDHGIGLVDVSDPDLPVPLDTESGITGAVDVEWYMDDLLVAGRRGLCAVSIAGDALSWDGSVDSQGDGNGTVFSGEVAYLVSTLEVTTADISVRSSPKALGSAGLPGFATTDVEVLRDGVHAVFACGTGGLQMVIRNTPESPTWIGGIAPLSITRHVRIKSGTDLAVVSDGGIRTVDVASPRAMDELGHVATPGGGRARLFLESTRAADLAYLADGPAGLVVVEFTDPENPQVIGGADTPGFALDVLVHDQVAYVADEFPGVQVFDVSDPTQPVYVQTIPVEDRAIAVARKDEYLLVSDGQVGVRIHDFATLSLVAFMPIPEFTQDVLVDGNVAYVPDQRSVHVLDLTDPAAPRYVGATHPSEQPFAVAVAEDAIWTADLTARAVSYPKQCPIITSVAFSGFEARATFWAVELTWSTSAETNHDGFRVERAQVGAGGWRTVTDEPVRGRSPYRWVDADVDADRTYAYRLVAVEHGGAEQTGPPVVVTTPEWPRADVSVEGMAPNPFRGGTTLRFALRKPERVRVDIHDVAGRRLRTLVDGRLEAGAHRETWDGLDARGRRAAAGVYFIRLEAGPVRRALRVIRTE